MSSSGSEYESDHEDTNIQTHGQWLPEAAPLPRDPGNTAQAPPAAPASGGNTAQSGLTTHGGGGGVRTALQQALDHAGQPGVSAATGTPASTSSATTAGTTQASGGTGGGSTNPVQSAQNQPSLSAPAPVVGTTVNPPPLGGGGSATGHSLVSGGHSQLSSARPSIQQGTGTQGGAHAPDPLQLVVTQLQQMIVNLQQLAVSSQQGTAPTTGTGAGGGTGQQQPAATGAAPATSGSTSTATVGTAPTGGSGSTAGTGQSQAVAASGTTVVGSAENPGGNASTQAYQPAPDPTLSNNLSPGQGSQGVQFQSNPVQTTVLNADPYATHELRPKKEDLQGYPQAYGYGGRTPTARTPMTAIATYGGYTMADYVGTPGFGFGNPFRQPQSWAQAAEQQRASMGTADAVQETPRTDRVETSLDHQALVVRDPGQKKFEFGMPPSVKNAVKMIQPFYSEGATVEKARSFWDAFERATVGLNDAVRLNAFRVLLKGKTGEDWWMYSRIEDFLTLKTRFYNQFICLTPLQMIERLKNAKRSKGMSVEVWGDVISNLCDSAQVTDPQMRYQYFLAGLRNQEWKAALQSTMVNNIPQAVMTLLYKNMHLPTEDESEFAGETTKKSTSEDSVMQQMMGLMQQTQNLLVTQNQLIARPPRSPRNRTNDGPSPFIAASYEDQTPNISAVAENAPNVAGGNRRMGPDQYTREGLSVCGRCHFLGCSRETCRYNNMTCSNCKVRGHVAFECVQPRPVNSGGNNGQLQNGNVQNQGSGGNYRRNGGNGNGNQPRGGGRCFLCDEHGHRISDCPLKKTVKQFAANGAARASPSQALAPSQQ